jgi:hypothetical protein
MRPTSQNFTENPVRVLPVIPAASTLRIIDETLMLNKLGDVIVNESGSLKMGSGGIDLKI